MRELRRVDPVERIVEAALIKKGLPYVTENDPRARRLDFYLPDLDLHIEVKQFHTPRVAEQMARSANIIVIQGMGAAKAFDLMLNMERTVSWATGNR